MDSRILKMTLVALFSAALMGCPPKSQLKKETEEPKLEDTQKAEEPSLRGKEYKEVADLKEVYFDLDQSSLRADARSVLANNYEVLKKNPDWEILVEGHCDERGTTAYNLALGQRRAAAVRRYYTSLGISGRRIATISYGKEKPVCMEQTEDCWARNRRGVTKVRINPDTPAPSE